MNNTQNNRIFHQKLNFFHKFLKINKLNIKISLRKFLPQLKQGASFASIRESGWGERLRNVFKKDESCPSGISSLVVKIGGLTQDE